MLTNNSFEEATSVGVEVGKWAKFDIDFEYKWTSNDPEPSWLKEATEREWQNVTVLDVQDTNVTVMVVTHFENRTEVVDIYQGNITSGEGNFTWPVIIAANLKEGDPIITHPKVPEPPRINQTLRKFVAGAERDVNFVPIVQGDGNITLYYFYWDKYTGFLCEFEMLNKDITELYNLTYRMKLVLVQTNLWEFESFSGPSYGWWLAGAFVTAAVLFISYHFLRKRKKRHAIQPTSRKKSSKFRMFMLTKFS